MSEITVPPSAPDDNVQSEWTDLLGRARDVVDDAMCGAYSMGVRARDAALALWGLYDAWMNCAEERRRDKEREANTNG